MTNVFNVLADELGFRYVNFVFESQGVPQLHVEMDVYFCLLEVAVKFAVSVLFVNF